MTTTEPRTPRDKGSWAAPVERLATTAVDAPRDTVTGKRVAGPIQGFGQMWQKTFKVRLEGTTITPQELIATWKDRFPTFWPKSGRFYAPLAGIAPGEVALLDMAPVPGAPVRLSTGVLVLYADDESFTFMSPEGHSLSAWITFSAYRDGDVTVAQAQALERTSDPLDELVFMLGGSRMNDRFWEHTLGALARHVGVAEPIIDTQRVCVDKSRQWRFVRNLKHSAIIDSTIATVTAPVRWVTRRIRRPR
jgi:hypothetical protein